MATNVESKRDILHEYFCIFHSIRMESIPVGLLSPQPFTLGLLKELNASLVPRVPAPHKLHHYLNFNKFDDTVAYTEWVVQRDENGKIVGAICYDRRDFFTHVFSDVAYVDVRIVENLQ